MEIHEALYVARFGSAVAPGSFVNGGVAVFETERIFGGDGGFYYVGTYAVKDGVARCTARITKHDPNWGDAFFAGANEFDIEVEARAVDDRTLTGTLWLAGRPDASIAVVLIRVADLP